MNTLLLLHETIPKGDRVQHPFDNSRYHFRHPCIKGFSKILHFIRFTDISPFTLFVYTLYLCICVCVFACQTPGNIISNIPVPSASEKELISNLINDLQLRLFHLWFWVCLVNSSWCCHNAVLTCHTPFSHLCKDVIYLCLSNTCTNIQERNLIWYGNWSWLITTRGNSFLLINNHFNLRPMHYYDHM